MGEGGGGGGRFVGFLVYRNRGEITRFALCHSMKQVVPVSGSIISFLVHMTHAVGNPSEGT